MDRDRFDSLTRVLATTPSRRVALGALLAATVAGIPGLTEARNKKRKQHRKKNRKTRNRQPGTEAASLSAEAVQCDPPRHSARLVGCDYSGQDLDDAVLHSSNLKDANFSGTSLIAADLHASTLTAADFTGANLCGANLSSSGLRRANFTGANLTRATLRASGCGGADFTGATFCNTVDCDGRIINPDCAATCACTPTTCAEEGVECGVIPDGCGETLTCGPCSAPEVCCLGSGLTCATSGTCNACLDTCPDRCGVCNLLADGDTLCGSGAGSGTSCSPCTSDDECAGEQRCILGWIFRENSQTNTISQICNVSLPVGGCVELNRCV